jgi:hypothetical protein
MASESHVLLRQPRLGTFYYVDNPLAFTAFCSHPDSLAYRIPVLYIDQL